MKVTLTDDEGHRRRSKVTKNELMVIYRKLLHSQTSYLVPRYNTISDIYWHKPFWPWLNVKVTTPGQRSQMWRWLRSLNASCFNLYHCSISSLWDSHFKQCTPAKLPSWQVEELFDALIGHCDKSASFPTHSTLSHNSRFEYLKFSSGMSITTAASLHGN